MTPDFSAGPHTSAIWHRVRPIIERTENLDFLNQLAQGTLEPIGFANYIRQDSLYLIGYARAMSLLAAKAPQRDQARFWAQSSASAITVEEEMHEALLADTRLAQARAQLAARHRQSATNARSSAEGLPADPTHVESSPTTLGYVSYLLATAATESYAVGVAGVLPCFWVYAHMGKVLTERAGSLAADHPYATWIAAYSSPEFDDSTRQAVSILEDQYGAATDPERQQMNHAFEQACLYEWHFWASAHELQGWERATNK
ncbi:MAG TPA: TenA family protein [Castellaniella sp.]|uniref:TenA family protein n=1 Tax=Castellaniella sp. TaxID=1955812 RepID=UPI002EFDEC6B